MRKETGTSLLLTLEYPPQIGGISTYLSYYIEKSPVGSFFVLAPEINGERVPEVDIKTPVPIYRRQLTSKWLRPRWLLALYWTWSVWRRERPSVLVVSHLSNMGQVAWIMRLMFGVPYVVILHGMDVALAASGSRRRRYVAQKILRSADKIICNSQCTLQLVKKFDVEDKRLAIVYPPFSFPVKVLPIDEQLIDDFRCRLNFEADSFLLLSVGRLVERKGFDTCLKAVAGLRQSGQKINYVVVGDGPLREKLKQMAVELEISQQVRFLGAVNNADLRAAYAACDVFIMVPRAIGSDIEGFGIVYLEAGLFGKPVIGSHSGGVSEAVLEGETGLLIKPGDANDLQSAVARLMNDPGLRCRLGQGGQQRLERDFGNDRQVHRFIELIRQVMKEHEP